VSQTDPRPSPEPKLWNVWWLLAILSAAVGVTALILEGLGVFKDIGLILTGISLFATILFGLAASTRNSVRTLHIEISRLRTDILAALGRIENLLRETRT
jgi:hypothetical protein